MKKTLLLLLAIAGTMSANAQRTISYLRDQTIKEGNSITINGVECSEPDVYYQKRNDGTYAAVRLTVEPQAAFSDFTLPYLNNATSTSIQVNWKTTAVIEGANVIYGSSVDNLNQKAFATCSTVASKHHWNTATLTGLVPDTYYYYKVVSGTNESKIYRFRTLPSSASKEKFRILVLGDHQRNERSDYEWLLKAAKRTLDSKYGEKPIEEHVRLLMNIGDQVDSGKVDQYEKVHLFKSREVMSNIPIMTTVGNHERFRDPDLKLYQAHYQSYGDIEYQGIKSNTAFYYAYQAGRVLFIVMNSDGTSDTQREWVRRVVDAADSDDSVDFIVTVQHRPMYAEQWCYDVCSWITNEIMPIVSASKKHVINLSGHHHLYARGQMTQWPVYHMITGGGVGTSATDYEQLWGLTPDNRDEEAVQKTFDHWTYQIAEFDPETLTMSFETYSLGNKRLGLDNELVDSFSRCLTDDSAPAQPVLSTADAETVKLPYTIRQTTNVEGLHSAEYQIAKDADFKDVVLDRVVCYENYYGLGNKYSTKNTQEGKTIAECELAGGNLANGTYYVRVRNRNHNLNWSEFSSTMVMKVTGQATLSLNKRFYAQGEKLECSYTGAPVGKNAWIGVYKAGTKPAENDSYAWAYTSAANGTLSFALNDWDAYYVVLFADGGYTEIARSSYVLACNDYTNGENFEMTTDKTIYEEGEPVVVTLKNAPAFNHDWLGIYEDGQTPGVGGAESSSYVYVNGANTSLTLNSAGTLQYGAPAVKPGKYYVTYLLWDGYAEVFNRTYFTVVDPEATAIASVSESASSKIYNLNGQLLSHPKPGVNIIDGRKVFVR